MKKIITLMTIIFLSSCSTINSQSNNNYNNENHNSNGSSSSHNENNHQDDKNNNQGDNKNNNQDDNKNDDQDNVPYEKVTDVTGYVYKKNEIRNIRKDDEELKKDEQDTLKKGYVDSFYKTINDPTEITDYGFDTYKEKAKDIFDSKFEELKKTGGDITNTINKKNNITFVESTLEYKSQLGDSLKYLQDPKFGKSIALFEPARTKTLTDHAKNVIFSFLDTNNDAIFENKDLKNENEKFKNVSIVGAEKEDINFLNIDSDDVVKQGGIFNLSLGSLRSTNANYLSYLGSESNIKNPYAYISTEAFRHFFDTQEISKLKDDRLFIKSLGNGDSNINNAVTKKEGSPEYENLYTLAPPELQKALRTSTILVGAVTQHSNINYDHTMFENEILNQNGIKYYTSNDTRLKEEFLTAKQYDPNITFNEFSIESKEANTPMILRATTVMAEANLNMKNTRRWMWGTSFSAPRVSRLAYDLKNKFPFLSYNQIRQIILTTATRNTTNGEYLSNIYGWGVIDRDKALRGPSDLNAGLIDEMKFLDGWTPYIFDKNKNRYFPVIIPENENYTFSNDITSGLKGDGNSKESLVYNKNVVKIKIQNPNDYEDKISDVYPNVFSFDKDGIATHVRIPKVLDSERLYYSNVAKAGLRKFGKGTLTLTGKQNYDTETQIFEGTIDLQNDSLSKYLINNDATLKLSKNLTISNDVFNRGNLLITSNDNKLNGLYLDKSSTLTFMSNNYSNNMTLNVDTLYGKNTKFKTNINPENIKINTKKVNENFDTDNLFINFEKYQDADIITLKPYATYMKPLKEYTKEELRNIPSYNYNQNQFYLGFQNYGIDDTKKEIIDKNAKPKTNDKSSNEHYVVKDNSNKEMVKNILNNYTTNNKKQATEDIFTPDLTTLTNSLNQTLSNNVDTLKSNIDQFTNNTSIATFVNVTNNIVKGKDYKAFSKNSAINNTIFKLNILGDSNLYVGYNLGYDNYKFTNSKFKLYDYGALIGIDTKISDKVKVNVFDNAYLSSIYYNRMLDGTLVNNQFKTLNNILDVNVESKFYEDETKNLSLAIGNRMYLTKIFESGRENHIMGVKLNDYSKLNDSATVSLKGKYMLDKNTTINGSLNGEFMMTNNDTINIDILGINSKFVGNDNTLLDVNGNLGVSRKISNKLNLKYNGRFNMNFDTKMNPNYTITNTLGIEYKF